MTDISCAAATEAAAEYALGILPGDRAADVSAHVQWCPTCRDEVEDLRDVGQRLLDLVPDVEPPLGFDRRVLSSVGSSPGLRLRVRHPGRVTGAVLAAAAAVALWVGLAGGGSHHPVDEAGSLRQDGRTVGSVYLGGQPTWISMDVTHLSVSGTVTCQLVTRRGIETIGAFRLVDGSGTWAVPYRDGGAPPVAARLLAPSGTVLATAVLDRS